MDSKEEKSKRGRAYAVYYIIGIIILILIIVYFAFFRVNININKILRCSDGTVYDSCSNNKSLYCSNGTLVNLPNKCGCNSGLILAANICKNPDDLLPNSNFSCKELVQNQLYVRFGDTDHPAELIDIDNSLINNIPLKNVPGKYCLNHLPAKAGENINVGNLFYCYGYSSAGGGVDSSGIVQKSYKISYEFTMDKTNCTNLTSSITGSFKKCNINSNSINCSWNYTN